MVWYLVKPNWCASASGENQTDVLVHGVISGENQSLVKTWCASAWFDIWWKPDWCACARFDIWWKPDRCASAWFDIWWKPNWCTSAWFDIWWKWNMCYCMVCYLVKTKVMCPVYIWYPVKTICRISLQGLGLCWPVMTVAIKGDTKWKTKVGLKM